MNAACASICADHVSTMPITTMSITTSTIITAMFSSVSIVCYIRLRF